MRQTTILTLLLAAVMSVALFFLKYEVADLEQELDVLNKAIMTDQETIHVLNAEWSHLNDIARIKDLATRYLGMTSSEPNKLKSVNDLKKSLVGKSSVGREVTSNKISPRILKREPGL